MLHHALLHPTENTQHQQTVAMNTTRTVELSPVLLCVAPVELSGPAGVVTTYALFDEGSTVTLVDASLAHEVGARGPLLPLTTAWTNSTTQTDHHSRSVSLNVKGVGCDQAFEMLGVRTSHNLVLPFQSVSAKTTARWPHLHNLPEPVLTRCGGTPRILIGQDNYHLIAPREIREGPPNAPVATRTKLGWVVHGNTGLFRGRLDSEYTCVQFHQHADDSLHQLVKESFSLDALGTSPLTTHRSKEEELAQSILDSTTKRTVAGDRWQTGLLWREGIQDLPES